MSEPVPAATLTEVACRLLGATALCTLATVCDDGAPYASTAYFALAPGFEVVWLSSPAARHSTNVRARPRVALAAYDSAQTWGGADRGIQLFGSAHELPRPGDEDAARVYADRFAGFAVRGLAELRFYRFRAQTVKLLDEAVLGSGTFVTARVGGGGLEWLATEVYAGG